MTVSISGKGTEQDEAVAFTQAKLVLAERWQPTALCPMGCRACCSRSEHPPFAGTSFPVRIGICCFPGSKGKLVQSGIGWEISKLDGSEPPFIPRRWSTYTYLVDRAAQG